MKAEYLDYVGHVYARTEGIAGVLISDKDYPIRVAYSLLTKILDEFLQRYPLSKIQSSSSLDFPELHGVTSLLPFETLIQQYLTKFQDPKQADTIMRVQAELDETKVVLHKTIESVLQRGEKLDSLVERSDALSSQSKLFYKTARRQVFIPFLTSKINGRIRAVLLCRTLYCMAWSVIEGRRFSSFTYMLHDLYMIIHLCVLPGHNISCKSFDFNRLE